MHTFLSFIKEFRIPKKRDLQEALASFSKKDFSTFTTFVVIAFVSLVVMLAAINNYFIVEIPNDGGVITEGIVGSPTLVNPVLALSDADKDIVSLVYSGLMRKNADGTLTPDIAQSYTVSDNGTTYTFILKNTVTFHDGKKVTADDVLYTISKVQDPLLKSPRKTNWDGVTVTKKDDSTVVFHLKQPYISFLDNTTIGILPSHIWNTITDTEFTTSSYNTKAIGSGPYQIDAVAKNNDGIPEQYSLKRFDNFALGRPHIKILTLVSFANEKDITKALLDHTINQAGGISSENAAKLKRDGYTIRTSTLPRIFGVFFNSTKNKIFTDSHVVDAFNQALDRQSIVDNVLGGYGTPIQSPIPTTILPQNNTDRITHGSKEAAIKILENNGWIMGNDGVRVKGETTTTIKTKKVGKKITKEKVTTSNGPTTELAFSLTTGDTPELRQAATLVKEQLEAIGARVDINHVYESGKLNAQIRARDYEALFFGQVVNHESDLYSFWHSSQRTDPGLNIALYSNPKIDSLLTQVQKTLQKEDRNTLYDQIDTQFQSNTPALLIYSPKYIYITSKNLNHITLDTITFPADRFASIFTWYADTDHVWKIFNK